MLRRIRLFLLMFATGFASLPAQAQSYGWVPVPSDVAIADLPSGTRLFVSRVNIGSRGTVVVRVPRKVGSGSLDVVLPAHRGVRSEPLLHYFTGAFPLVLGEAMTKDRPVPARVETNELEVTVHCDRCGTIADYGGALRCMVPAGEAKLPFGAPTAGLAYLKKLGTLQPLPADLRFVELPANTVAITQTPIALRRYHRTTFFAKPRRPGWLQLELPARKVEGWYTEPWVLPAGTHLVFTRAVDGSKATPVYLADFGVYSEVVPHNTGVWGTIGEYAGVLHFFTPAH